MRMKHIIAGLIIDGNGNLEKDMVVTINGDHIEKLEKMKNINDFEPESILDCSKLTLLPGLIDSHIHLSTPRDPEENNLMISMLKTPPQLVTLWVLKNAQLCMEAGFTTLRDFGGIFTQDNIEGISVRKAIDLGLVDGPSIVVGGSVLQTSSHPEMSAFGRISHLVNSGAVSSDGPWEVRKRVRKIIGLEADFIKVFASAWFGEVEEYWWPNFTLEEIEAVCDETHSYKKRVAAHVTSKESMKKALIAGCDTLEHLIEIDDEIIELILEKNVTLIPTLDLFSEKALSKRKFHAKTTVSEQMEKARDSACESFRKCLKAGVRIAMGTDIYRTITHGENAHEITIMVQSGMKEMDAIVAATKNGAYALGLEDKIGTIEANKIADLILVDGNPLNDIKLLEDKNNIKLVIKKGEIKIDRR